jgi:hypothetical protein
VYDELITWPKLLRQRLELQDGSIHIFLFEGEILNGCRDRRVSNGVVRSKEITIESGLDAVGEGLRAAGSALITR